MKISESRAQGMKVFIIIFLVFLTGCASNYKDFKASDVRDDEGIVIGKVEVTYNKEPYNIDLCKFCIGSNCHDLLDEGYVFMSLIRDEDYSSISLFCHYIGGQGERTHIFNISPLKVKTGVTYIGNLLFLANEVSSGQLTQDMVLPERTSSGRAGMLGAVGVLLLPERKPIQVVAAMLAVKDDMPSVLSAYQKQVGDEEAQAEKSIVTVGVQAEK
jgi:hypothetical protein